MFRCLVRRPDGGRAGEVDDELMSFIDLAPTVLSLAGLERPPLSWRDAWSFGPERAPAPQYVFMHRDRMDDTSHDTIRAVRDQRFRYVRNFRPQLPYLQPIAYRDRVATMGEIYRVLASGDVPPTMWQWAAHTKPVEEFYDTEADPDEVHNLIDDPNHQATIEQCGRPSRSGSSGSKIHWRWTSAKCCGPASGPLRASSPPLAPPELRRVPDSALVSLSSATPGASLGYRLAGIKSWRSTRSPWSLPEPNSRWSRIGWVGSPPTQPSRPNPRRRSIFALQCTG